MNYEPQSPVDLSDILGPPSSREEILTVLKKNQDTYQRFRSFPPEEQKKLLSFIAGQQGLKITYDPFFQKIFSPYYHLDRLERFLSDLLHEPVRIEKVLPREGERLSYEAHIIIMDILVKLEDGARINVEIQKIGMQFPGERSSCYIADSIMKEYNELKHTLKENFVYRKMRPVYLIVLMEKSSPQFSEVAPHYIHTLQTHFDSGAKVNTLENIIYISLDTFHEYIHNINNPLDAWLTFLSSDQPEDILKLVQAYPEFRDMYAEIAQFRKNTEELIHMYSEALTIADNNTAKLMIDEMQDEIKNLTIAVADKDRSLADMGKSLADKDKAIKDKDKTIAESITEIEKLRAEILRLKENQ